MLYATNLCVVEEGLLSAFNNFASRLVTIMFLFPRAQISFMRDVKYLAYECRQKKSTDRSEQQQLREGVRERGPEGQRKKKACEPLAENQPFLQFIRITYRPR